MGHTCVTEAYADLEGVGQGENGSPGKSQVVIGSSEAWVQLLLEGGLCCTL